MKKIFPFFSVSSSAGFLPKGPGHVEIGAMIFVVFTES